MTNKSILHSLMFFFVLCQNVLASSSSNPIISTTNRDESSLLALRTHVAKPDTLAKNWSEGTPFCTWIGVSCGRRHPLRVTALNLSYIGLQGTVPEEIGNLSFLSYLNIGNNSFNGPIPNTIGNLGRLRVLVMRNNQFTGQIPFTLGKLTKLEKLILSGNQLTGTIPSSIFNVSSLLEIHFHINRLSGTLPDDICHRLPKIEVVSVYENKMRGNIPMSLSACGELRIVELSFNNFSGNVPMEIGNLTQLQGLYLEHNNLTGVIPSSITNLSNLEALDMGYNSLHGTIPSEIGRLSNLNYLNFFRQNKLSGEVPHSLFNLSKLTVIGLRDNELFGKLPSTIVDGVPYLQELYLANNRLSGEIPTSISNLSSLTDLSLTFNSFSGYIPTTLGYLSQLQELYLGGNQFSNNLSIPEQDFLTPLINCNYLSTIQIAKNPITGEIPRSFGGATNLSMSLEQVIAFSRKISGKIPTEIGNLSSLILLDLGDNELVGTVPESLGSLTNLQWLGLYSNALRGSIPCSFCGMKSLYRVGLWENKLSGPLPSCLGNLTSLRELHLEENGFTSNIPSTLWFNTGIQVMILSHNFFNGTISRDIGNMKSISTLHLSSNQLSGDIPSSIQQLWSLTNLSLSDNMLNGSIPESFSDLKGLQYLDLSRNRLSGSIPKSLENLEYLEYFNVSFNELSGEIPDEGPFENFGDDCFIGNKGLCSAARFKVCEENTLKNSSKNRLLRYILPPIALIFVIAIVLILFMRFYRKKSTSSSPPNSHVGLSWDRISYYEILRATNNLDQGNLIGRGSYGSVYKGQFFDTMIAAVKVFDLEVQGALKSFDTECQILRSIRHRNLVKVITSCANLDFKALVMEYMPNGNLDKWLYSSECSSDISQRIRIMVDVAIALEYLHYGYSTPIVHCDLKPNNILLDDEMVAHFGDFGIAKLLTGEHITPQTKTLGTIGYMAPEYGSEGLVSTKVDVYCFGIVLMETFTRRKPTDEMFSGELTIKRWVFESFPDSLMQIVDAELLKNDDECVRSKHERCLTSIIGLALDCTSELAEERPNIKDVLRMIEKIRNEV